MKTEITINDIEGFVKAIKDIIEKNPTGSYLYRGQANAADWKLYSGALRRLFPKKKDIAKTTPAIRKDEIADYQKDLLEESRKLLAEELKDKSELESLAQLQHQGAATFLLDFTHNALVALWFACSENKGKDAKVFCIDTSKTKKFAIITSEKSKKPLEEIFYSAKKEDQDVAHSEQALAYWKWTPSYLNTRILKQDSVFLISTQGLVEEKDIDAEITIPEDKKAIFLTELRDLYNLSEETFFSQVQNRTI